MKKFISILIALSVVLSTGCTKFNTELDKKLSYEQWVEDIDFFSKELKIRHPNLYLNISESEFDKNINNLKNNINHMSDVEVSINLEQILSRLKDAHTDISLIEMITPPGEAKSYDDMKVFPITYKWFDDGLRVYSCDSKYKDILGLKLVSINDIELNEIIDKVSTTYSYDNDAGLKSGITKYISVYEILKFIDIVDNNSAKFVFEKDSGDEYSINLDTMDFKNVNYINLSTLIQNESEISTKPTGSYDDYWFKYIEKDNILYFQYNKCINNNSYWLTDEEKRKAPDFYKFVDDLITSINSNSFDKFVIDIRNNPGGTLGLTNYLLIELEGLTNIKQNAKTYVITSENTFSSATQAVVDIANNLYAVVVGTETGSNVNMTTIRDNNFQLPNSKITVNCAKDFINKIPGYKGGYKPDIQIEPNFKNYINGLDDCYEFIKNN